MENTVLQNVIWNISDSGMKKLAQDEYNKLMKRIVSLEDDCLKLQYLESYGVDNWEGYSEAMREMRKDKGEE
jgi:hypothetical protein